MSKIIADAAIRGAHKVFNRTQDMLEQAVKEKGEDWPVQFPNTAYYLPVIFGFTGKKVEKLSDINAVLDHCKELLPDAPSEKLWLPYLGNVLDAGVSTLFCCEIIEALKYIIGPHPVQGIWLGAADDVIMRERGVEFVDGSAPGFAAVVGAAPSVEEAVQLARELQEKSLYVFIGGHNNEDGKTLADQLEEADVQMGWDTRLVPFGPEITAQIYSLGFATRAAMAFGGVQPGDYARLLRYNQLRVYAFVLALSKVSDEDYATAAGAISYGFPVIAHRDDVPEILPRGITTYEHVVSGIPIDKIVQKAIDVRGLKITITKIPIPLAVSPAFEGERVRKDDVFIEAGGSKTACFELLKLKEMDEVEDNKITVVGPEIDSFDPGSKTPLAIVVDVAGRKMQKDFEPIVERQFHHFVNSVEGVMHIGQRDIAWIRISKTAKEKGFKFEHFGHLFRAKIIADFPAIVDKVQVTIYTDEEDVLKLREEARGIYHERDERVAGLTDDAVDIFYSCTLCQSFAPTHICVIQPERLGLCGAYNWLDGKAAFEISPTGANQPIEKGETIDAEKGQWKGVNEFLAKASGGKLERFNAYSMMEHPMTSCGCFECIVALLPMANGVMIVDRDYSGMTPCGMTFSTLAGTIGGGVQMPGFIGVGKYYLGSEKFISADGGFSRLVWMPKALKEQLTPLIEKQSKRIGDPDFINKIADETTATTEDEVLEFMQKVGHPALILEPMIA